MQQLQSTFVKTNIGKIPIDWKLCKLQDLAIKITDGTHKTPTYLDKGVPFLRVTDIQNDEINWNEVKRISISEHKELLKRCKPENGDILLSKNGTIGITKLINWQEEFSIFVSLCLIKPNHNIINNQFLSYVLRSDLCFNQMGLRSKQGTVTNLHLEEIRELSIPTPPYNEQQRIASILANIDELIQKTDQIIEQTQRLKKGLMQRLLTKGIGHTKFKKTELGEIPEEWNVIKLNKICKKITDGTHKTPKYTDIGIPFISVNNLSKNKIDFENCKYISRKEHEDLIKRCNPVKGDILLSKVGTLGIAQIVNADFEFSIFVQLALLKPEVSKINPLYLKYVLNSKELQRQINNNASGSTLRYIGINKIENLSIPYPLLTEQQKIASILANVDELLQKQQNYKSNLENLKKGLMQQLLTGKIRVKV